MPWHTNSNKNACIHSPTHYNYTHSLPWRLEECLRKAKHCDVAPAADSNQMTTDGWRVMLNGQILAKVASLEQFIQP